MQDLQAAFRSISSSVSGFLNVNPVINEACEDSSTPTPGYLYKEIADMTFESTDTCMRILDLLCEKLDDRSAVVKYKALNVVKNVLQKGSPAFFREMGRKHMTVRDCLNFRGPPDPLHGDAPYSQVRDLAQQVINMLFDTQPTFAESASSGNPYALSNAANAPRGSFEPVTQTPPPITSFSSQTPSFSSTHSTSSNIPSSNYRVSTTVDGGRRVYVNSPKAIGSYVEYQPSRFETFVDKVSEGLDSFKASLVGNTKPELSPSRPYGYGHSAGSSLGNNLATAPRYTTGDVSALDASNGDVDISTFAGTSSQASIRVSQGQIGELSRPTASIIESWEYKMVADLTPHTGRPAPARTEIRDFVQKATQLASNTSLVPLVEALLVRAIVPDQWQSKLKALCLIEALLKSEVANTRDLLRPHLSLLVEQSNSSAQTSFKERVDAVIAVYPQNERPTSPAVVSSQGNDASHQQAAQDSGGLFDGLNDHTSVNSTAEAISLIDLDFSHPAVALVRPSHQPLPQHSILVPPTTAHQLPTLSSESLFDGLDTSENDVSPPKSTYPSSGESLLVDFGVSAPKASATTSHSSSSRSNVISDLERDFFNKSTPAQVNDPLATLGQLQAAQPSYGLSTTTLSTASTPDAQISILRGRREAIEQQLEMIQRDHPQQHAYISQLATQLQEVNMQISQLMTTSTQASMSTTRTMPSSGGVSLEALYRQQPTFQGTSVDYQALQTSHPSDPFDFMRHDMRR